MGYVQDTAMAQFVPPLDIGEGATATMTFAVGTNVWSDNRTANNSTFTIYVPVPIPSCSEALMGACLKSIELMYSVDTEDMDAVATVVVYKDTLAVTGTLNTAAVVASTVDTGHDTSAERLAQDEHRMLVTLTTPEWIDNDATFHLEVAVDGGAAGNVKIFGAIANFTLRL
jgi:hypothetical protein